MTAYALDTQHGIVTEADPLTGASRGPAAAGKKGTGIPVAHQWSAAETTW
jgi:hypothetical protein